MTLPLKDTGSFRDPAGSVFVQNNQVLRSVNKVAREAYESVRDTGVLSQSIEKGFLVDCKELKKAEWPFASDKASYLIEHPLIPYISYPYEWSFSQLKAAALHHLDFQLFLLDNDVVLSDATAYNVQFIGAKPVFIDLLSLRPYKQGEFWEGHRQFCEQFLNPLLLRAYTGITHNAWFRGTLEGIPSADLSRLISPLKKLSWNVLSQVVLPGRLEQKAVSSPDQLIAKAKSSKQLSKNAYKGLLLQMRRWISKLTPLNVGKTTWQDYAHTNTYTSEEASLKAKFVRDFVKKVQPKTLIDIGCNTGDYSVEALEAGAKYVVGFDFDPNALDAAFSRSSSQNLPFLALFLDAANPSPSQGWQQMERQGFSDRTKADALVALAFEHHLAIARNVPLDQVIRWLVDRAPEGIIEFVPKKDSTVQRMLELREDIFPDYDVKSFEASLKAEAAIVKKDTISEAGRTLFWYRK